MYIIYIISICVSFLVLPKQSIIDWVALITETYCQLAELLPSEGCEERICFRPLSLACRWLFSSSHGILPVSMSV